MLDQEGVAIEPSLSRSLWIDIYAAGENHIERKELMATSRTTNKPDRYRFMHAFRKQVQSREDAFDRKEPSRRGLCSLAGQL